MSETGPRFDLSSKARLTSHDLGRFAGTTLFDRLARTLCEVGCLPRKELYEAWEVAKRVRRLFRGGRVVDMAGGHGLLAHALLLLDDSSPEAHVVARVVPASAAMWKVPPQVTEPATSTEHWVTSSWKAIGGVNAHATYVPVVALTTCTPLYIEQAS